MKVRRAVTVKIPTSPKIALDKEISVATNPLSSLQLLRDIDGRKFIPNQVNNVYIFPAMAMAPFATEAERATEDMFLTAAQAIAEQVREDNLAAGLIYPPRERIFRASLHVAERVAARIFDQGLAGAPRPDDVGALIRARVYRPLYPE